MVVARTFSPAGNANTPIASKARTRAKLRIDRTTDTLRFNDKCSISESLTSLFLQKITMAARFIIKSNNFNNNKDLRDSRYKLSGQWMRVDIRHIAWFDSIVNQFAIFSNRWV